ncbi:MAG: DUF4129 domain-containing protein [Caldivirga sp.]
MRRDAVIMLIIGLISLWLLTSSIRVMTLPITLSSPGGGGGSGAPTIGPPLINITIPHSEGPVVKLPSLTLPSVPIPLISIELPIPNITRRVAVINVTQPHPPQQGGINGTGHGSGVGNGGKATQQVTAVPQLPITAVLVALVIIMAASSVFAILTIRGKGPKVSKTEEGTGDVFKLAMQPTAQVKRVMEEYVEPNVELLPNERINQLSGWGGGKLLKVGIPPDLPLIWGVNEPLKYEVKDDVVVKASPGLLISSGQITAPREGCYEVTGESSEGSEHLNIRFTDYSKDVERLFRLNVVVDLKNPSSMTPRELVSKLVNDGVIKDKAEAIKMTRIFEGAYYGKRSVSRADYEAFIRALGKSHTNPRVIVCG